MSCKQCSEYRIVFYENSMSCH